MLLCWERVGRMRGDGGKEEGENTLRLVSGWGKERPWVGGSASARAMRVRCFIWACAWKSCQLKKDVARGNLLVRSCSLRTVAASVCVLTATCLCFVFWLCDLCTDFSLETFVLEWPQAGNVGLNCCIAPMAKLSSATCRLPLSLPLLKIFAGLWTFPGHVCMFWNSWLVPNWTELNIFKVQLFHFTSQFCKTWKQVSVILKKKKILIQQHLQTQIDDSKYSVFFLHVFSSVCVLTTSTNSNFIKVIVIVVINNNKDEAQFEHRQWFWLWCLRWQTQNWVSQNFISIYLYVSKKKEKKSLAYVSPSKKSHCFSLLF
jgi:hypothetical protein